MLHLASDFSPICHLQFYLFSHISSNCDLSVPQYRSDSNLIYLYSIISESNIKATRIRKNDHQHKEFLTVKQNLLISPVDSVWRTLCRICILI